MNKNLKVIMFCAFLALVISANAQADKRVSFHNIPEIMAFDAGMKIAIPLMKTSLEESMYTDENIAAFDGKKGIKKIIDLFIERFDPNYISDLFFDEVKDKYSEEELNCIAQMNCKETEVDERWKADYAVFQVGTESYASKYGETLMLQVIAEVVK